MLEIKGRYSNAKVFTNNIEESAKLQIQEFCNNELSKNLKIRIMPDVHTGIGCTIGFTCNVSDKISPSLVGVDIGCGMLTVNLGNKNIDLQKLDNIVKKEVPSGNEIFEIAKIEFEEFLNLRCYNEIKNKERIHRSIGTLGSGNHFCELSIDSNGDKYLIIHTGSRNLGSQVFKHYDKKALEITILFDT